MLNSTMVFWLVLGLVLCGVEAILPTAFVACVMGISALAIAFLVPVLPHFGLQVVVWMGFSVALVILSRRFVSKHKGIVKLDATEAETLTEIAPGKVGRVLYEGNSWQARCEDYQVTLAPKQKVYVVGRRGTTLLIVPDQFLNS